MLEKALRLSQATEESRSALRPLLVSLAVELNRSEEWWSLMYETTGSFVARAMCAIMADSADSDLQDALGGLVAQFEAAQHADLVEAASHAAAGPFFQDVLRAAASDRHGMRQEFQRIVGTLLNLPVPLPKGDSSAPVVDEQMARAQDTFWGLAQDTVASHTIEVVFQVSGASLRSVLADAFVLTDEVSFRRLATHDTATFVLQKYIGALQTRAELDRVLAFCSEAAVQSVWTKRHIGVFLQLALAVLRCADTSAPEEKPKKRSRKQNGEGGDVAASASRTVEDVHREVLKKVYNAVSVPGDVASFARLLLAVRAESTESAAASSDSAGAHSGPSATETAGSERRKKSAHSAAANSRKERASIVSLPGAALVEALLDFHTQTNRTVLESIVALDATTLVALAQDPVGGRKVLEKLLQIPVESTAWAKHRLARLLKGHLVLLAEDRFGAYVVTKLFDCGTPAIKEAIARELSDANRRLSSSRSGDRVCKHCLVAQFLQSPTDWKARVARQKKRKASMEQWHAKEFGQVQTKVGALSSSSSTAS